MARLDPLEGRRRNVAEPHQWQPDAHPELYNFSAAFMLRFMAAPEEPRVPEFVYVPTKDQNVPADERLCVELLVTEWNLCWEAAQLRHHLFDERVPAGLAWLRRMEEENVFLLPRPRGHRYYAYAPLFHLLPKRLLTRHGLPLLKRGIWPHFLEADWNLPALPLDFDARLERAFADLVWPFLVSGSGHKAFTPREPIRLLAHNLDFWLPHVHAVVEDRLNELPRVKFDDRAQRRELAKRCRELPPGVTANRPRCGGVIWAGEAEAGEALEETVTRADASGRLAEIVDAVRSNRDVSESS